MAYKALKLDRRDTIYTITLNLPETLNALSDQLLDDLNGALDECAADNEIRVLVLTGAGRGFCAGADISEPDMSHASGEMRGQHLKKKMDEKFNPVIKRILDLPVPTIAAVNGVAAGGGYGLALACDLVIAADSADFILVFTNQLGLIPDMGATWHAPRSIGRARAIAGAYFGERMPAREAAQLGLIWKSVPDAQLQRAVDETADKLARGPTRAYKAVRQVMDKAPTQTLDAHLDLEAEVQSALLSTDDFLEGVQAFLQKRHPDFQGQ